MDRARTRASTKALEQLIAHKEVELFLPWIVVQEVHANLQRPVEVAFRESLSALNALRRTLPSTIRREERETLIANVATLRGTLTDSVAADFEAWLGATQVQVMPVAPEHGIQVMEDYFAGLPPFAGERSREDIPDAFIFQSVKALVARVGEVSVVATDNALARALSNLPLVTVYDSLESFLGSDVAQTALRRAAGAFNLAAIIELLRSDPTGVISTLNEIHIDRIAGETISSSNVPGEENEATVCGAYDIANPQFDWAEAEYYGEGRISVPVTYETEVQADFAIPMSDYYAMSDRVASKLSISPLNDYVVSAEATFGIEVIALVVIDLGHDLARGRIDSDELDEWLSSAVISIDSLRQIEVTDGPG